MRLCNRANNGANGNPITNSVTNPYCIAATHQRNIDNFLKIIVALC